MASVEAALRLERLDLAGHRVPHERSQNLAAIDKLLKGEAFYTFGIRQVDEAIAQRRFDAAAILGQVAALTGCSADPAQRSGPGYIDPERTLAGLRRLAEGLASACRQGAVVTFGTGHPGCLIGFWGPLALWARRHGARVVAGTAGQPVGTNSFLDYVGLVGVVSDGAGLQHSHALRPAELVLQEHAVDLVFGDHGWAGAALNAGRRCLAVMDTNDPGLAVAHALGVPGLTVVPMADNSPNGCMGEVADWVIRRAQGETGPLDECGKAV